ncbi:hypothetical protein Pelo_15623 [Pelomyxa schiedti]|nr:hypothetical protein Pelo_15623 [Pelomyxa schiedti]
MAATPTITLTTTSGSIKPCPSRSVESRNEQPASVISVSSSTWSLVPRAQSTISASGATRPAAASAAVTHPCRRLARKPRKVVKAVARATDKGVLRSVLVSVGLVVATAVSVWLVWYTTSTKVVSLMADDTMSDTSNIIFNEIHQTVRVLYRQLEFFDLALSFNPNFFGEDRVTEMWSIQTAALLNEQTQFSMIIAPTDPYTFDHLIEPSLLSSQDVALSIVFRVANSSDSIVITIKDGNKSQGQALSCIDGTINWPLLLQSVTGKEIAFFDPVHVEFLGFQMFVMSVQKALYSGETPIAWLYTGMEVPTLTTLLSGINMGTNSFSYIVDSHGKLLAVLGSLTVESTEFGTVTPDNSSSTKVVHTWGLLQDKIGSISENETCKMQYSDDTDSYFLIISPTTFHREVFHYHPHPSAQWLVVISLSSTKYTESSRLSTRFSIIITCALVAVLLVVGVISAISLSKKRGSVSPEPKIDLDAGITKTGGLFMPDLKKQTCLLDTDIQKWLNEEIAPSKLAPDTPSNVATPLVSVVSDSNDTFELNSMDFCVIFPSSP